MKCWIVFMIFSATLSAWGSSADSLSTVVDLEGKITQKVKSILQPVDPDAIVVTKIEIKKTTTDILGTQLTAVGIFSTGELQKIEDTDIDSINVTVISKIEKLPREISKYVESAVVGISKKGRVQFTKMDPVTMDVILKRQEYQKINSEGLQKLVSLAEQIYKKAGMALLGLLIGFASVELVLGLAKIIFQAKSATKLGNKIAAIKLTNSEESSRPLMIQPAPGASPSGGGHRKDSETSFAAEKNSLELMSAISLRALLSDAYWCERDRYAAWVWSCLSPLKKIELLESWGPFESYVGYLSRIEPEEDRFHLDPAYLKPQPCHQVSNKDIMNVLKTNKAVWLSLSQMRRQNLPLALRERIDFSKWTPTENQGAQVSKLWGTLNSPLRALPAQLGINSLTEQDELVLMENPEIVTGSLRRQLPSLVWVALLPKPEREKLLQKIPAQSLAEVWVGPQKALQLILEVLPEKKRELLHDYAKKIEPMRDSSLVLSLSNSAHDIFERSPLAKSPEIIERKVA